MQENECNDYLSHWQFRETVRQRKRERGREIFELSHSNLNWLYSTISKKSYKVYVYFL